MVHLAASLEWAHVDDEEAISPFVLSRLRQVFGQGQPVNVSKIVNVQKKLQREAQRRNAAQADEAAEACEGHLLLMVDAPHKLPCTAAAPCLHGERCVAESELPEGAACQDRSPQSISQIPLEQLHLFAQCHRPGEAGPTAMHKIDEDDHGEHAASAAPEAEAEAEPAAPAEAEAEPAPPAALRCRVCNHGTSGACLHAVTGDCAPFNHFGVCPPGHAPCQPNPCADVRAPCFDPASPATRPVCVSKQAARCRVLDPTGSVCLSHACPPGTVESQSTRWQAAFYPDGKRYHLGLYRDAFLLEPGEAGLDTQVWLPAGSNVALPTSLGGGHGMAPGTGGWAVLHPEADIYWSPLPSIIE